MKYLLYVLMLFSAILFIFCNKNKETGDPWTANQLMQPSELASRINDSTHKQPVILDIGFFGGIKNSIRIGPASDNSKLEKLKEVLNTYPKDADIIIYCGCCPFDHCPNIKPAFELLSGMHFTNFKLLNLPHNLKTDWKDKGYPMSE